MTYREVQKRFVREYLAEEHGLPSKALPWAIPRNEINSAYGAFDLGYSAALGRLKRAGMGDSEAYRVLKRFFDGDPEETDDGES